MTTPILPLNGYLLMRLKEVGARSKSGLMLPGRRDQVILFGEVLAVSAPPTSRPSMAGASPEPTPIKVGDVVFVHQACVTEVVFAGEPFLLLRAADAMGQVTAEGLAAAPPPEPEPSLLVTQ